MKYIAVSEVAKKSGVEHAQCLKVLRALSDMGELKKHYVSTCSKCNTINGVYGDIEDVRLEFSCENCGEHVTDILSNTYVAFTKW